MNQQEIDKRRKELIGSKNKYLRKVDLIDEELHSLLLLEGRLEDPHALIPNSYSSYEEAIAEHPFPEFIQSHKYKNRREAQAVKNCSNTYLTHYKIVKVNQ